MRTLFFSAAVAAIAATGCFLQPCPQVDCANVIDVTVTDASGQPLQTFSGEIWAGDQKFTVSCGMGDAGTVADAGTESDAGTLPDGGQIFARPVEDAWCDTGHVRLFNGWGRTLTVKLTDGTRSFEGEVDVTRKENPVGPDYCQSGCSTAEASVTLQ